MNLRGPIFSFLSVVAAAFSTAFAVNLVLSRRGLTLSYPGVVILGISLLCYAVVWVTSSILLSKIRDLKFWNALLEDGPTYLPAILFLLNIQLAARWLIPFIFAGIGILKIHTFRKDINLPLNSKSWRETLGFFGLVLVIVVNLISTANRFDGDFMFILSNHSKVPEIRLRQKMVMFYGKSAGAYYDFIYFIEEKTDESARILVPLKPSIPPAEGLDLINGPLDDYVLYPRKLVNGSFDAVVVDPQLTHVVLVPDLAEIGSMPLSAVNRIEKIEYLAPGLGIITLVQGQGE